MKIRITTKEKRVSVDNFVIDMPELDWNHECFMGAPNKKWDDVEAVQFDDSPGGARHIELITVVTDDEDQANFRAADKPLNREKFDRLFGWVLPLHAARKAEMEAERARVEAENEAARQAAIDNPTPVMSDSAPIVDISHLEAALADKDSELAGMRAKQDVLEAKVNAMLQAAKDVGGEAA